VKPMDFKCRLLFMFGEGLEYLSPNPCIGGGIF